MINYKLHESVQYIELVLGAKLIILAWELSHIRIRMDKTYYI